MQPTIAKIFVNRVSLGFDEAEALEPTQVLRLTPSDLALGKPQPLRMVRFTAVHAIHVRELPGPWLFWILVHFIFWAMDVPLHATAEMGEGRKNGRLPHTE